MPRRRATARASSTVSGEQQLPNLRVASSGSRHGHTRSVTPITSKPCSTRSAAATEESTPPLRPTTIRSVIRSSTSRRDELGEAIELLARGVNDLDPPGALGSHESHPGRERDAERIFDRGQIGRATKLAAGGPGSLGLHALLGGAYRPRVGQDLVAQLELVGRGGE